MCCAADDAFAKRLLLLVLSVATIYGMASRGRPFCRARRCPDVHARRRADSSREMAHVPSRR